MSLVLGFATKDGTDAQAIIGPERLRPDQGRSNACQEPAEEGQVLAALSKGEMRCGAQSKRATSLTNIPLKGFAQALTV